MAHATKFKFVMTSLAIPSIQILLHSYVVAVDEGA